MPPLPAQRQTIGYPALLSSTDAEFPSRRSENVAVVMFPQIALSWVQGGVIEFALGELPPIALAEGDFVEVEPVAGSVWNVRSLAASEDSLELALAGHAQSLAVGPAPRSQQDRLPSRLRSIYSQPELEWTIALSVGLLARLIGAMTQKVLRGSVLFQRWWRHVRARARQRARRPSESGSEPDA